jgi:hypothetical protein
LGKDEPQNAQKADSKRKHQKRLLAKFFRAFCEGSFFFFHT